MNNEDVYLYGLNESDFIRCWNIGISNSLHSSEYTRSVADPNAKSIRDIDIEELKINPNCLQSFADHRSVWYVWAAAILRRGGEIGEGISPYQTRWKTVEQQNNILLKSNRELAFEEGRRKILPQAASRLCCLFLAENNDAGSAYIQKIMSGRIGQSLIMRVGISVLLRLHKADAHWFDEYADTGNNTCIENYWTSIPHPEFDVPQWEYLLEGVIELCDKNDELQIGLKSLGIKGMMTAQQLPKILSS